MKASLVALLMIAVSSSAFAMKNLRRNFDEPCDSVWKAALTVAKTQDYRIVSVDKEDQIISLIAGGAWFGERIITVTFATGAEKGCVAAVQSRFSGVVHSDGPDLLARIGVELISERVGSDSTALQHYRSCIKRYNPSEEKCEEKLRKEVAHEQQPAASHDDSSNWWNVEKH
jgi:hypothetical protein